jgi:hypothetical protein
MTYHLHTENLPNVPEIVSRHFPGFTLTRAEGYWRGISESSAIIEITTTDVAAITALAADLRSTNRQESVLIESLPTRESFCSAEDCAAPEVSK